VINAVLKATGCSVLLLLLGACNVGSDEGQQSTVAASNQLVVTTSSQGQTAKPVAAATANFSTEASKPKLTETYYLLLQGLNGSGKPVTNAYAFQKNVSAQGDHRVQLIWFEPNRAPDSSCLPELSGYELAYGHQPHNYNARLTFDLASQDMVCATVGTTECGDVRECRYTLNL